MRTLYSRYLPLVRGQVERILQPWGGDDEVVQAVFLRYAAERHEASTHHDPIAHLYRLSTRVALQTLRAPRRSRTRATNASPHVPTYEATPPPEVLAALRHAPPADAELVALFYLAEMSHLEIGETLAIPAEVVAQRLSACVLSEAPRGA